MSRSTSPWSQTMKRIHSPTSDMKKEEKNSHPLVDDSVKLMPLQDESASSTPRKRNNSLIPVELMINNSDEGGRECAALATVFGVPEYIDSKIFWQRQQYQHEGLLPKKQINPLLLRPSSTSNVQPSDNSKYGYVSVNNISVVSRPLSSSSSTGALGDEDALQSHQIRSKLFISSYVDSILDPVGSNELLKPAFLGTTSSSAPTPTPTKSFSLPQIPTVSKFNDFIIEDENGIELMLPANPSSILMHPTPMMRSESVSSVHSSYTLPSQSNTQATQVKNNEQEEAEEEEEEKASNVVVIIGPPEIFDLIVSDEDERFIIWGPDPIVLSSSMATTTTPERPSSYAELYNNQHNKRPELKGFSSNATSTLSKSTTTTTTTTTSNSNNRPSFGLVRLSAQSWSESLKLVGRPTLSTSDQRNTSTAQHGSLLLRKAFRLKKNQKLKNAAEAEKKRLATIPKVIEAATIHKLVEKLTNTLDYTFMTDFFLTYRDFLNSQDLCQLLVSRFYWALQNDEEARRIVRIRTFVVLRHWLNNYFVHDFIGNRPLRTILTDFLNRLPRHPLVKSSPRDQRIVKILKRVVRRLKKLYYNTSSGASRVKVIAPPPPTAEQEQMSEIVRAKLSQNVIRRKTALGVDMSSHHNGNMAVQDARYAPVVVVGSLSMKTSFIDSGVDSSTGARLALAAHQQSLQQQQQQHYEGSEVASPIAYDDSQSSVYHRKYAKSFNKSVENTAATATATATATTAAALEVSSVVSVASDDSLESELSAGETAPQLDSDDSEDEEHAFHPHSSYYYHENDNENENDREWIREQQETLEYFRSMSKMAVDRSGLSHISGETVATSTKDTALVEPVSPHRERPKIPSEFYSPSPTTTTTTTTAAAAAVVEQVVANETSHSSSTDDGGGVVTVASKNVRRVPSERWCKTDHDDETAEYPHLDKRHPLYTEPNTLPDELLKELSGDEAQHKTAMGLSRKLSKKSIERRKSEKSFHELMSSAASSTTTSPHLNSTRGAGMHGDVPELPPLTPAILDQHGGVAVSTKKKTLKKKKSLTSKRKSATTGDKQAVDAFAAIPYEATQTADGKKEQNEKEEQQPKRRISRVLSKVFKPHSEEKPAQVVNTHEDVAVAKEEDTVVVGPKPSEEEATVPQEQEQQQQQQQQQQGSQLVSLIAQRLRYSSFDDGDDEREEEGEKGAATLAEKDGTIHCDCIKCSNNKDSHRNCKRLSAMLILDEERRRSFELRRKRGASIDMEHQAVVLNELAIATNEAKNTKELKSGPVYLGHLQARSLIGSSVADPAAAAAAAAEEEHSSDSDDDDDDSVISFAPSERSIRTEAQASTTRARMSFLSEATSVTPNVPRSKMIELGIPPVSPIDDAPSLQPTSTRNTDTASATVPHPIPNTAVVAAAAAGQPYGRCFIMSYRTSMLASQLCFIERDVLVKVGWEELIHCKWTKMDASGNIHTAPLQQHNTASMYDEFNEEINYTRQTEQRRVEEQGIEQVIQRFNTVCQWVASEIVRTRNLHERVKLIEKFIRLAKKCKMYSNYATLVQILLGLQSPAVARLEKTWSKVSTKCQKQLSKLTEFTSPMKNWKNIRDSMTEVAEEYGNSPSEVQVEMPGTTAHRQKFKKTTRIKIPFGGCIPFLGIYLSDLVFNSEKPRFLQPNLENQRIYTANTTRNLPACLDQPLVNFRKHRVIATVIKRVLTFQGLATRYSFDEDGLLLEKCRNLYVLDAAKIRKLSASLE